MILITSETPFNITNANEQFLNKWIFYSPSIVTGVDFSIDTKQNHYIYVKGFSINPLGIYQQSTRNRNIDTLYYFIDTKQHNYFFNELNDVKKYYKNIMNATDKINNVCRQFNEDDETYINENNFFELYCFVEYQNDTYNTNKKVHYELILQHNGFILSTDGNTKKFSKEKQTQLNNLIDNTKIIDEYLSADNDIRKTDIKFKSLRDNIDEFKLKDDEIQTYKSILTDKFIKQHYSNFIKLIETNDKHSQNILLLNNSSYTIKELQTIDNKVNIIKILYSRHNIKYLSLDNFHTIDKINITDDEYYSVIKPIFRIAKNKPTSNEQFKIFIVGILRNLIGNLDIIDTERDTCKNNRNYNYIWNHIIINHYIYLYKKYNDVLNFNKHIIFLKGV